MISHGASLVLVQVAKGLGTVYALLGLAAFLHFPAISSTLRLA